MLRKVKLYGRLAKRFGKSFDLDIEDAPEAVRALSVQIPGFRQEMEKGQYRVVRGRGPKSPDAIDLGLEDMKLRLGKADLHIIPVAAGSKGGRGGGAAKIVLGAAIVAMAVIAAPAAAAGSTAFFGANMGAAALGGLTTFGGIAMMGVMMAVSGIAMMLSPQPKMDEGQSYKSVDQRESFIFSAPRNISEQGATKPLVYGQFRVGSVIGSTGLTVEQI